MFQITIFFLYTCAAAALAWTRTSQSTEQSRWPLPLAGLCIAAGLIAHVAALHGSVMAGGQFSLTLTGAASVIGLQLTMIAAVAAFEPTLRGVSSMLLIMAAIAGSLTFISSAVPDTSPLTWQIQLHIGLSMFAYGLLTAGAIVAVLALIQDHRLRTKTMSPTNRLFAPLETTERLLFGVAGAGFLVLAMAVVSGATFVDNLFAQHLVHKTTLSLLALFLFGVLVAGRRFRGWRGRRAVSLYLGAFFLLCVAYFGSRYILEEVLNRSWG